MFLSNIVDNFVARIANNFQLGEGDASSLMSRPTRWGPVRKKEEVRYCLGHKFQDHSLSSITKCSICDELIYFFGHRCAHCNLEIHKKCMRRLENPCINNEDNDDTRLDHDFRLKFFCTPTCCNHCGELLVGVTKPQGLKCCHLGCSMAIHERCRKNVRKLCPKRAAACLERLTAIHGSKAIDSVTRNYNMSIKSFEFRGVLGQGSFSRVYLATHRLSGKNYAIKTVKKTEDVVISDPESAFTEMKILRLGRDFPFLTKVHGCFQTEDRLFFVMEYFGGRDLVMHMKQDGKFPEDRARFYTAEVVLALEFLHKNGIIHRDLKLDNVMLDNDGHCKLLDFGMSKELHQTQDMEAKTFCGTPNYISPEILRYEPYGFSVDWWTLGIMVYEMLVGYSPFEADDELELYKSILHDEPHLPSYLSASSKSFLSSDGGLLTKNPIKRLGYGENVNNIREHGFFSFPKYCGSLRAQFWVDLRDRKVKPPEFTKFVDDRSEELVPFSPTDLEKVQEIDQNEFKGFSFCSESIQKFSLI